MWQRWNGTSHVFEKSDDNGSSWAPLPLSAATITEGVLSDSRLSGNIPRTNIANTFYVGPTSFTDWLQINRSGSPFILFQEAGVNKARIGFSVGVLSLADGGGNALLTMGVPSGLVSVNSAGPHDFYYSHNGAVAFYLTNQTNGTGAYATYRCGAGGVNLYLSSFSPSYTPSGYAMSSSAAVYTDAGQGLTITAASTSGYVRFFLGGSGNANLKFLMAYDGGFFPNIDNTGYVGYPTNRLNLVRAVSIVPGDLTFDNGWTVTEATKVGIAESGLAFLDADENLVAFVGATGFKDISTISYTKTTKLARSRMPRVDHPSLLDPRKIEANGE